MEESQPPLILCIENANGEDVALQIEPEDDFQTFLDKAKSILGFDVDINSITGNQPVLLEDNIYQFLVNAEQNPDGTLPIFDSLLEPTDSNNDSVYILDDGTQIKASQIHFDNDDPPVDLTAEALPFVKNANDVDDEIEPEVIDVQKINIIGSPVSQWSSNSSPKCDFGNTLPFKVICNNTSGFELQFTKYLEETTKSCALNEPSISKDYESYDDDQNDRDFNAFTREEVLNMFKDSPVASLPYDNQNFTERKHVRKTDPLRPVQKNWNPKPMSYIDVDGTLIGQNESQDCCTCGRFIENSLDKLYLFDNEDQRLHRLSPQKKMSTQLKILCQDCLEENFKPCFMKNPNQPLNSDEYLIIKNNQQYIYQRINDIQGFDVAKAVLEDIDSEVFKEIEFSKIQIAPDIDKIIGRNDQKSDVMVKNEDSSDVEIIEELEMDDLENLEEADEEVKEFLGKYKCDNEVKDMKCRFCNRLFSDLSDVIEHSEVHKHDTDDGEVFPCPLCYYGYANSKWLKGHLKAAHDKTQNNAQELNKETHDSDEVKKEGSSDSKESSPIARRTRSANKSKHNIDCQDEEKDLKSIQETDHTNGEGETKNVESPEATGIIKSEVKQECLDTSDDESIWIFHTADDNAAQQLQSILRSKDNEKSQSNGFKKLSRCENCSEIYEEGASPHKCQRRGRKRKSMNEKTEICVPTEEDFIRRAQGRPKRLEESNDNDLLVERITKRKNKQPSSDPQIVTCHNCGESFTSKVRLKFHMQFHESTSMLSKDGQYTCVECEDSIFTTETELFDHVHFQHNKQRRWQCPVEECGKTFYLRATLTKHSRTHTDTRRYVCVTCGKRFLDKQTLDEHGVTHLQIKPFQCHICMKQLTRRSRLRMHLRAHEEELSPTLVLVCAVCNRAFRDHQDAQEHATKSMECIEVFANELKEEEQEPSALLSPTSGHVTTTVKIAESSRLRRSIERQVDDQIAEQLLSQITDEARSIIRVVDIEKAFRCEYCEDVFYLEDGLNTHRVIHKGVKNPFTCHICKVSFATYSRCTTHKTTHGFYKRSLADAKKQADKQGASSTGILGYGGFPVVKHFLCEDCGRSYLHWTYLQVHRRMKHSNENVLYKCNNCELTFPNSWSVTYHRKKVHGNSTENCGATKIVKEDYRIPCRDCDEVLPNKTALYKHRKDEHSDMSLRINSGNESVWSEDKLYHTVVPMSATATNTTCNKCGQNFVDVDSLEGHFKEVHIDETQSCPICDAYFATCDELQTHVRTHSQRPYTCSECGHAFRTASMRNEHLRTHTGERPYPCDLCGVAFRR